MGIKLFLLPCPLRKVLVINAMFNVCLLNRFEQSNKGNITLQDIQMRLAAYIVVPQDSHERIGKTCSTYIH